jgi:hypothetical protein
VSHLLAPRKHIHLLNQGEKFSSFSAKERINRSYLSLTIRLSLLAPDIVEAILNGTQPATLQLADLEEPFSAIFD